MQNVKEILKKLKRLAEESTFEGEKIASQKAYDRIYAKHKDEENISDDDLQWDELELLNKYGIRKYDDGSLDVPKTADSIDAALTYLLMNWKGTRRKSGEVKKINE